MAITCNGTNQFLVKSNPAALTGAPLTMAAWAKSPSFTNYPPVMSLGDNGSNWYQIFFDGPTGKTGLETSVATVVEDILSTVATAINTWVHVCGVWTSTTSRAVFTNGADKQTSTVSKNPGAPTQVQIGAVRGTSQFYGNCTLAYVGYWNVALTDPEVASLAAGFSPLKVRPTSLISYCMCTGQASEPDLFQTAIYAPQNAPPFAANPRIYL